MKSGLMKIEWHKIENFSEEDITYFLFLEGKSIEVISRIRNLDSSIIQKHIIDGKIKYRFLAKSNSIEDFFTAVATAGKEDKLEVLNAMDNNNKINLIKYVRENYVDMRAKDKEAAIWILGELKDKYSMDILIKASVHKFVNIRRMAVSAIGKIGDISGEQALIRALEDSNPQVVMYSINSLLKIKSKRAKEKIENIKNTSDKEYLIRCAEKYLSSLDGTTPIEGEDKI